MYVDELAAETKGWTEGGRDDGVVSLVADDVLVKAK